MNAAMRSDRRPAAAAVCFRRNQPALLFADLRICISKNSNQQPRLYGAYASSCTGVDMPMTSSHVLPHEYGPLGGGGNSCESRKALSRSLRLELGSKSAPFSSGVARNVPAYNTTVLIGF